MKGFLNGILPFSFPCRPVLERTHRQRPAKLVKVGTSNPLRFRLPFPVQHPSILQRTHRQRAANVVKVRDLLTYYRCCLALWLRKCARFVCDRLGCSHTVSLVREKYK